jgi:hypothetical protein
MPDFHKACGIAAAVISVAAFVPYLISILRGKTVPSRATWIIWTAVNLLILLSYRASGAQSTLWIPVVYLCGTAIVMLLSLKYGEGGWSRLDRTCIILAGASVPAWLVFREPLVALCINIFIDFLGALPTVRKAYREPGKEDKLAWGLYLIANVVYLGAVEQWTFRIAIYPVYLFVASTTISALVFWPRKRTATAVPTQ